MTAQVHIDAIGKAITDLENAAQEAKQASRKVVKATRALHDALGDAEAAYIDSVANDSNVVAFSGGNPKPPVDDPDEPVKP